MKQGQRSKVDGSQSNQDKGARAAAVRAASKAKRQAEREASKAAAAGRAWASVRREASAAAAWQSGQTFVAMMEAASVQARQEKHRCERLMAFAGEANKARQAAAAADLAGGCVRVSSKRPQSWGSFKGNGRPVRCQRCRPSHV